MADKDQVIQALRATLISVKGALTVKQCNRDYRELQGEPIPFKKLGYPTLEKLFLEIPGFKVTQINGEWYVDAIASQETQHIAAMVARQKPSKKPNIKLNYPNRFPKKQGSWRKPFSSSPNYTAVNYSYDKQYSNQYYRAKGGTAFNNNTYNNKYNNKQSYNKTNETKPAYQNAKPLTRSVSDHSEKNGPTLTTKPIINATPGVREFKHPVRPESEKETKYSGKVSASQRLSNLRDRLSTVDLIPLHFPAAKNECLESSGPVTNVTPAHNLEPPPDSTSSVEKLEWTCRKLGLPQPVYNVINIGNNKGPGIYHCAVKVGNLYSVSSYPDSSPSEDLAKEMGAVKTLGVIESLETGGNPTSSSSHAIACLADLVAEHEAGLWANMVPHLYREKYGENLPSNWQELVENCPRIIKDSVVNGLLVLLPNNNEKVEYNEDIIVLQQIDSDLPPLQFPEDDFWSVFVTVANSTLEVWLRIIGPQYSDAYEAQLADMALYYEHSGTSVDKSMLIKNAWYAVNLDDGGWQRAKILEIEEDTATVFLGDHGDDDIVKINKIKILDPQYRKIPAQAILCRLDGAEELAASSTGASLVSRRLPGEVLVAAPGPRADPADPSVAVVLYDTSTARDLNLNKEILHDFCIAGAFNLTQKPCEVEVGCVSEEGRVWVSRAGGATLVRDALALLTAGPYRRPLPAAPHAPSPNAQTLYIVRTLAGDWVRCTIISGLDGEGTVRTQLVDSGLILRAPLSSLVPLQAFSPALSEYPWQAMQVRLGSADRVAPFMVERLRELLLEARVLCRALPSTAPPPAPTAPGAPPPPPPPPNVELFVRIGPQNILASVNNSIIIEFDDLHNGKAKEEEKEATNHVEELRKKKERIFRSRSCAGSLGATPSAPGAPGAPGAASPAQPAAAPELPPPPLPAVGRCFDVYIAMAANPWNFVVQPNGTRHTLLSMMSSLQEECPKSTAADAPEKPASGELYTVFYDKDSTWYRVTVAGVVSNEMVSVYFCDYGDLALFPAAELRPVPAAAPLARSLPPQAIKARLYDVWPLHQDWTVEDCIRFQELCVDQQFVGICKDVGKDPLNPSEPLLTLDLIDTSTDEDIYLSKQLVAECRARLSSTPTS